MKKELIKELARDFIAFGSIPFLIMTIVRVSVIHIDYPLQFIISSIVFFTLNVKFKGEMHAGIGLILLTLTSLFYNHALYAIFALFVYMGIIISLLYLERDRALIFRGILLGAISTGIGYVITRSIFFLKK